MPYPAITDPTVPTEITRTVNVKVEFWWNNAWVDETENLLSASGAMETTPIAEAYLGGKLLIQRASIVLANRDKRYSEYNSSSPIWNYIKNGGYYRKKARIQFAHTSIGPWENVFQGYIKLPEERYAQNQIVFEVWDIGEVLRTRYSTAILNDMLEHELVCYYLATVAGLQDGVDFISPAYATANSVAETIDYSTTPVPHSWLDDEPIWDELVDIAQAAAASLYVGRDGKVYFRKGWRWAIPATTTALDMGTYGDISPGYLDKTFYDEVRVGYAPRFQGDDGTEVWEMGEHKLIEPGKTEKFDAKYNAPCVSVSAPVLNKDYFLRSLHGADMAAWCTFSVVTNGQQATITATNNTTLAVVLGRFKIKGRPLLGRPSEQVKREIVSPEHGRRLEVRENPYVQTKFQADAIADFLVWWYSAPKTVYKLEGVRGVATRELGQRATVSSGDFSKDCIITRIEWTIKAASERIQYVQKIELVEDVFQVSPGYFIIGTHAPNSNRKVWL